jgi:lysophospholipase L1-like esterase
MIARRLAQTGGGASSEALDAHIANTANPHGVTKTQVGLDQVDNTSDANKPISTATQTALNAKANINSPTFTGTVGGITKSMVGLGNVDNTSDASKPISTATQTAINATNRNMQKLRRRVCSTRGFFPTVAPSDLTVQTRTFTYDFQMTDAASELQIVWLNHSAGRQVTIKASAVIGGVIYPLFFNGSRVGTLAPGGRLISDPLSNRVAKGAVINIRTYADAGTGNVIRPNGTQETWGYGGTWTGGSTGIADYTDSASPPALETQSYNGIVPLMVVGLCNTNCLLIVGDSISAGGYISNLFSWQRENFGSSSGSVFNQVHVGRNANTALIAAGGEAAKNWNTYWIKRNTATFCDVAIVAYGANESNDSVATIQASLQAVWNDLHAMGIRVWACTITPSTTSTDSWATVGNQTDIRPNINTVNDWIRTLPAPLVGVIDVSDAVSSARNSGRWKAGFTSDGLHPNLTGQVPLQTIIPAGLLD